MPSTVRPSSARSFERVSLKPAAQPAGLLHRARRARDGCRPHPGHPDVEAVDRRPEARRRGVEEGDVAAGRPGAEAQLHAPVAHRPYFGLRVDRPTRKRKKTTRIRVDRFGTRRSFWRARSRLYRSRFFELNSR